MDSFRAAHYVPPPFNIPRSAPWTSMSNRSTNGSFALSSHKNHAHPLLMIQTHIADNLIRCRRTSYPPGHLVLGLDAPHQDGLSPPEFNMEVLVDHGQMELESPLQLFGFQSLSCQPVLQRTNAALFDASASSTFARSMKYSTTLHAVGSVNETMCLYT